MASNNEVPVEKKPRIGKSTKLVLSRHVFRARTLCRGNAEYERLLAEAKHEFDVAERRAKERNTPRRKR